jgi:hypothetical protein
MAALPFSSGKSVMMGFDHKRCGIDTKIIYRSHCEFIENIFLAEQKNYNDSARIS